MHPTASHQLTTASHRRLTAAYPPDFPRYPMTSHDILRTCTETCGISRTIYTAMRILPYYYHRWCRHTQLYLKSVGKPANEASWWSAALPTCVRRAKREPSRPPSRGGPALKTKNPTRSHRFVFLQVTSLTCMCVNPIMIKSDRRHLSTQQLLRASDWK